MSRVQLTIAHLSLFPGLGLFYFALMMVGQIGTPPFELESLRPFGVPTLGNLIEIPIAAAFGAMVAIAVLVVRALNHIQESRSVWRVVKVAYLVAVLFYFLMPSLPE